MSRPRWERQWDLLNWLAKRRGAKRYLEIGIDHGDTFDAVAVPEKVGVDPRVERTRLGTPVERLTSDEYFATGPKETFDLIFVDGDHTCEQSYRDLTNAMLRLNAGGAIVLHDCLPEYEWHQSRDEATREENNRRPGHRVWNGDVWKAAVRARALRSWDLATWRGCFGCAVVLPRDNTDRLDLDIDAVTMRNLTWADYEANRDRWLRVMTQDQIERWVG